MKIFITGDTHTEWVKRLSSKNFPEGKTLTENDYVIVCGDFGIWDESKETVHNLKWLATKTFKVLFVSGNHDNYNLLKNILLSYGMVAKYSLSFRTLFI